MKSHTRQHDGVLTDDPHVHQNLGLIGTTRFEPRSDIKNILITGGAGFIVSSLSNIRCLGAYPNFQFVQGNLADKDAVLRLLRDHEIDCVLHFAACSHVQNSFEDPSSFTVNNVVATQRLLDAVRAHGQIRRFIHVSTDEVYGDAETEFVDESQQLMPTNPYSASKAAAEMYVWAYAKSFDIPIIVVRSNNVYGPCQYPEKIIPRSYALLSKQQPLTIQGSDLNVRRYLYGADAADGFDTLLHRGVLGEAYNISSTSGATNPEVAVRMLELFGYTPKDFSHQLAWTADRPFNDHDYRVDGSKLEALGWRQRVSFTEGLKATVDWYRDNMHVWWLDATQEVSPTSTITLCYEDHDFQGDAVKETTLGIRIEEVSGTSTPVAVDID